jgi:alkyl hydroperoxide reductase subunit AhpC
MLCCLAAWLAAVFPPSSVHATGSSTLGAYILPVGGAKPGDAVPKFQAKGIYGEDLSFDAILAENKYVVLTFWSMYCKACIEKFNAMVAIQEKYRDQGLKVVSINTDGEYRKGEQSIRNFITGFEERQGIKVNFPILYDESNWLALAMNIDFLPTIITVDSSGKIRQIYRRFGEVTEEDILAGVEKIVVDLIAASSGGSPPP